MLQLNSNWEIFKKFTDPAKEVLKQAQKEAQHLHHYYVDSGHLLFGLTLDDKNTASQILLEIGVDLAQVRSVTESIIKHSEPGLPTREINFTPRVENIFLLAVAESERQNHKYVDTKHLLLGLMLEDECVAAGILHSMNVNLSKVREVVIEVGELHT